MSAIRPRSPGDEWLVTAGDGSYAMGTVSLLRTRRYHGILMRSVAGPCERRMLVTEVSEQVSVGGTWQDLGVRAWASGAVSPDGRSLAPAFAVEDGIPTWTWALSAGTLTRRHLMERQAPVTLVHWSWAGHEPLAVRAAVLTVERDAHGSMRAGDRAPSFSLARGGANLDWPADGAAPAARLHIRAPGAALREGTGWWLGQSLAAEAALGYEHTEDVFHGADVEFTLRPGTATVVALGAVQPRPADPAEALQFVRQRARRLAEAMVPGIEDDVRTTLAVAADQFIVAHPDAGTRGAGSPMRRIGIVAGYPWFAEWGRDTMLSVRGLLLHCGRVEEAALLLRAWAASIQGGLLPNRLPDRAGDAVEWNSADAPLLFVRAVAQLAAHGAEQALLRDFRPAVREIIDAFSSGTSIGVGEDPADGLVIASSAGRQLTWMDAKCGDWVVTPRRGKPVEIAALWHEALLAAAAVEEALGDPRRARSLAAKAEHTRAGFGRFWSAGRGFLADVLDGPDGDDWSLRPNQLFALAQGSPREGAPALVDGEAAQAATAAVASRLLAGAGVRTLDEEDGRYRGRYEGRIEVRDAAYHNGTAWPFLLALLDEALGRWPSMGPVRGQVRSALRLHLAEGGLGSVSEILDGDPPHAPRGCPMQAWSVAAAIEVFARRTILPA